MEFIQEFLVNEALIVIPVLMIIGKIIKETPKMKDWLIPYIILIIGVILTMMLIGFDIDGLLQGVLVSGTAVFAHQLVKQGKIGADVK